MNVAEVKILPDQLIVKGIQVDYQEHEWDTVAKFLDPDGNLCASRETEKLENQLTGYLEEISKK